MNDLTLAEERVLRFIVKTISENDYPPSVRDIQSALGYNTTSVIKKYIDRLAEKGYIYKEAGKGRAIALTEETRGLFFGIPVLGTIAAGLPILAEQNFEGFIPVGVEVHGYDKSNLFSLRIKGDSMKDSGIINGDYVIIDCRNNAENGETVAAMIDGEATVKVFYKREGKIVLEPRNPEFSPIISDNVTVLGKVIACMRLYN